MPVASMVEYQVVRIDPERVPRPVSRGCQNKDARPCNVIRKGDWEAADIGLYMSREHAVGYTRQSADVDWY